MDRRFGKYKVVAELGHGGMADVFLTIVSGPQGLGFSKLAVVKRLRENLADDPECVGMLVDEARISARLNHPNVVQTLEVGEEDGHYYIAMEFLDGQPLHRVLRRARRDGTPIARDLQIAALARVLKGLHHAHEHADYDGTPLDIVHRDVTPHNVFVTYDGQVKVVDFGIAKAARRTAETQHGVVKGKVRYMAPEQAMGQSVDRRADLFAVGVMLWEAATGTRFWDGMEDLQVVSLLVQGLYGRSARELAPEVPEDLDRVIRKALAPSPADRYATAEEMYQDLADHLGAALVSAPRELGLRAGELFAPERECLRLVIGEAGRLATSESFAAAPEIPIVVEEVAAIRELESTAPFVVSAPGGRIPRPQTPRQIIPAKTTLPSNLGRPAPSRGRSWIAAIAALSAVVAIGLGALRVTTKAPAGATRAAARAEVTAPPHVALPASAAATPVATVEPAAPVASPAPSAAEPEARAVAAPPKKARGGKVTHTHRGAKPAPKAPGARPKPPSPPPVAVASTLSPAAKKPASGANAAGLKLDSRDPW